MANNEDLNQLIQQGTDAIRRGDRSAGRNFLEQALEIDQDNERAWMWMASCVTTLRERRACL